MKDVVKYFIGGLITWFVVISLVNGLIMNVGGILEWIIK